MNEITAMKLFLAIAEAGSIAGGASAMSVPRSVASRQLAQLESRFQAKLMHRSTRMLTLTDAGRIFQQRARAVVGRYDQLVDELAFEQGALSGQIRIASNDLMGQLLLPKALSYFRERHRGLSFSVTITDEPLRLLKSECDLAIHAGSSPGASLIGRPVHAYKRVLCASPSYWRERGLPRSPDELDRHDCIVHTHNDRRVWHFQTPDGGRVAQPIEPVVEANSYPTLLRFAKNGLGIVRIARVMTDIHVADGSLEIALPDYRCIEPDGTDPTIWLTYADRSLLSRVRLVADYLHKLMRAVVSHPSWIAAMEEQMISAEGEIRF